MSNAAKRVTFGKMLPVSEYRSDGGEFDVFLDGEHCGRIEKDMIEAYHCEWRVGSYTVYLDYDNPHYRTFEVDGLSDSSPWSKVQRSQYKTSAEAKAAAKAYARRRAVEIAEEQAAEEQAAEEQAAEEQAAEEQATEEQATEEQAATDEKELVKLAKDACRKSDSYFRMYQVWNRNLDRIRTTPQMKIRNDHQDTWNAWSRHAYTLCRLSGVELSRGVLSWAEWQGKPVPAPVPASN